MAAIDIPEGLTLRALREGLQVGARRALESPTDEGPPKRRPIPAAAVPVSAVFKITRAAYSDTFEPWYRVTLGQGALWFNWTHPLTGAPCEAQFAGEQAFTVAPSPGGFVKISAQLRMR